MNIHEFPKVADIVRNMPQVERSLEDRASIAWMQIERAIERVGAYGAIDLDDKTALMALKSIGSWSQLCHTKRENMGFKRREFIENYRALENTEIELIPKSLNGLEALIQQRLH